MTATTILVVDDDPVIRGLLTAVLERAGFRVAVAADGAAALAHVRARRDNPPALVLTDLLMPGLDGCALAAQLRLDDYRGAVLLMSAGYGESPLPAYSFVRKPFDVPRLLATVGELIGDPAAAPAPPPWPARPPIAGRMGAALSV